MPKRVLLLAMLFSVIAAPAFAQASALATPSSARPVVMPRRFTWSSANRGLITVEAGLFGFVGGANVTLPPVRWICRRGWACRAASMAVGTVGASFFVWKFSKEGGR